MRVWRVLFMVAVLWQSVFRSVGGSYPAGATLQSFDFPAGTRDLTDGSVIGTDGGETVVGVFNAQLRLTDNAATNVISSFKLPVLDPDSVVRVLDFRLNAAMTAPEQGELGEGWSINFGNIPDDNGTGEGGFAPLAKGLTISFRVRDTPEDPSGIVISVGGVVIAEFPRTFNFDTFARPVSFHWDSSGLDLSYNNQSVCSNLALPGFSPDAGDRFAITARTTTALLGVTIDNLKVTTTALPILDTGGPIISEFVASNSEFEDEFADQSDWLELFNGSPDPIDFTGWYLTDSKKNLTKWRINGLTLAPYTYQVVFASGRDRQLSPTSFPHANFSLGSEDGYLALVRPDGSVASSYEYGQQARDVSFGEQGASRTRGFMFPATPGLVNGTEPAANGLSPEILFSHSGGFITGPIELILQTAPIIGVEIRYTLDRTEPGTNSLLYTAPIRINEFTHVRARSFAPNYLPGRVSSRTYVVPDASLTNYAGTGKVFESNLPIIYLDSFGFRVDGSTGGGRPFRPSYAVVIPPDPNSGRATLTNAPEYLGPAGTHVRGESSAGFGQLSYALELQDDSGQDMDARLLGMPAESDWVLYGPWSEKTLMRNKLVFDWMIALRGEDGTAVRSRWVELFFNQSRLSSGRVGANTYRGIYVLMEKIKRGGDRVPLENQNSKTVDPELITGGYIIRKDKPDSLKNSWTSSRYSVDLQSFDPDRLNTSQLAYIRSYITTFETALSGTNFRDPTRGYRAYIDPDTFIDAQWMLEIAKQVDGYVFSTYWHKDRGGRLRAGPLWDFNIALGNADYGSGDSPTGWLYGNANGVGQIWYPRLHADPEYKLAHWDRYWEMRRGIFSNEAVMAKIQENMRLLLDGYNGLVSNNAPISIQNPVARHFRRWPRLGQRDWPNPPAETSIRTWQAEVGYMTNWLRTRLTWLDDQSLRSGTTVLRPPVLSHPGGHILEPLALTMQPYHRVTNLVFPQGDIFFTLDKSDPRLTGGEISPSAIKYENSVVIDSSLTVKARLYYQKLWSPLASATFLLAAEPASASNLVVSEILYSPAPLTAGETNAGLLNAEGFEFIELRNINNRTVDLSGVRVDRGVDFDFDYAPEASRLLQPGESVVLVSDKRAFSIRYPGVPPAKIAGQFRNQLNNGGEAISVLAADGSIIRQFAFEDSNPWPATNDRGHSIILNTPAANPDSSDPASWTLSAKLGGTPGVSGLGADTFSGDPLADADYDGFPDLFEFASGSDPENPNSFFAPFISVSELTSQGIFAQLTYRWQPAARGVRIVVETSPDLLNWSANSELLAPLTTRTNLDGTVTETFRSRLALGDNSVRAIFYRVKAAQE